MLMWGNKTYFRVNNSKVILSISNNSRVLMKTENQARFIEPPLYRLSIIINYCN